MVVPSSRRAPAQRLDRRNPQDEHLLVAPRLEDRYASSGVPCLDRGKSAPLPWRPAAVNQAERRAPHRLGISGRSAALVEAEELPEKPHDTDDFRKLPPIQGDFVIAPCERRARGRLSQPETVSPIPPHWVTWPGTRLLSEKEAPEME